MTGFITRVMPRSDGENYSYEIIIDTDEEEKYKTIQEFCRALIDHSKPTSNIVEVVRCKDCKHWDIENKPNKESDYCLCECYRGYKEPSGFCDIGERRTEDE